MFKIKNKIFSINLTNLFRIPNRSGLRSSSFNHNFVYRVKHCLAKHSFSYPGPFLWNYLPSSLTLTKSLTVFRNSLKTHRFGMLSFPSAFARLVRKRRYRKLCWLIDWILSQLFSYRPKANLTFISKVIEKVVYKQIYSWVSTY